MHTLHLVSYSTPHVPIQEEIMIYDSINKCGDDQSYPYEPLHLASKWIMKVSTLLALNISL